MKPKILILTFIIVFVLSGVACSQDIKYAIIKIRTDPIINDEKKENVEIYFLDENGNQVKAKPFDIKQWPIEVNPEHKVRYIDSAFWYISNPTCVVWDGRYF